MKKKIIWFIVILGLGFLISTLAGCGKEVSQVEKIKDLEYQILSEEEIPQEVLTMIEEKKEQPFKFTFSQESNLYICVGYGKQESGGYSILVHELFLTKNAIYADTGLLGPDGEDIKAGGHSYPYIVICTENLDKTVVFE